MSQLFTPLELRSLKIHNRIFLSPMCQYSCVDGIPNNWHLVHYGSRAAGGAGLVMVEATGVLPEGRISPRDCGLWNDDQAQAFKPITAFISEQGAIPGIQLGHAGRKASVDAPWLGGKVVPVGAGGWQPLAPSPLPFTAGMPTPTELKETELEEICNAFVAAAERAFNSGFKIVEVHMAHGYLLHQFLSPLTNKRADQYGGSLENRMRFPLQVAKQVRNVWPEELPVFVRISATDWVENGWDLPQSIELCKKLKQLAIDLIDCSTGGLVPDAVIPVAPGFQVPMAAAIKQQAEIATGAVGLITEAEQAEQILAKGEADAVFLARELLRNPYWPLQAAKKLQAELPWRPQYERAKV